MALLNKYEPCKEQKELMEQFGFVSGYTCDDDIDRYGKVSWSKKIPIEFPNGRFKSIEIFLYLSPKYIPLIRDVVDNILDQAFKLGKDAKTEEIKNALEIHQVFEVHRDL